MIRVIRCLPIARNNTNDSVLPNGSTEAFFTIQKSCFHSTNSRHFTMQLAAVNSSDRARHLRFSVEILHPFKMAPAFHCCLLIAFE